MSAEAGLQSGFGSVVGLVIAPGLAGLDLVSGVAKDLFTVALGSGVMKAGVFHYAIYCTNGTNHQARSGTVRWSAEDKGGVIVADATDDNTPSSSPSSGTLTIVSSASTGSHAVTIRIAATTSLPAPTKFKIFFRREDLGSLTA